VPPLRRWGRTLCSILAPIRHERWEDFDVPATLASFNAARLMGRQARDAVVFECVGVPGMLQTLIETGPPAAAMGAAGLIQIIS
jgi:hypothetical protein